MDEGKITSLSLFFILVGLILAAGCIKPFFGGEACGDGICDEVERTGGKCSEDCPQETTTTTQPTVPLETPVYVTIVSHNERDTETGSGVLVKYGDMRVSKEGYVAFRDSLITVAEMIHQYGLKYSYQTDYMFLDGIELYEEIVLKENSGKPMASLFSNTFMKI